MASLHIQVLIGHEEELNLVHYTFHKSILLKEKYKNKITLNFSIYLQRHTTEFVN